MDLTGLDLGLLPGLCTPKQVDKAFLQGGSSDWDMTLEALFSGEPWWLLQRGPKTMLSMGSLAIVAFPAPTLLRAPPHPWVLRELPFLVPLLQAPSGPWQWVATRLSSTLHCGKGSAALWSRACPRMCTSIGCGIPNQPNRIFHK